MNDRYFLVACEKLLGHNWKYNFPSMPNKRICKWCGKREQLNLITLKWFDGFKDDRSNDELIGKWFS